MTQIHAVRVKNGTKELARIVRTFRGRDKVKVGFPTGTSTEVLDKAVYNEFGTRDIPERPFLRNALRDGKREIQTAATRVARSIIARRMTKTQGLNQLGILGKNLIQESITDLRDPPNAGSTIETKGSSNPLIDSGEMRRAVTWKVE